MTWTTEKPQIPGWYWRKYYSYNKPVARIVHVIKSGSYLVLEDHGGLVESLNGDWAGPLEVPKE
jgi:hypothetical protein